MATSEKDYRQAQEKLASMLNRYEYLRNSEDSHKRGSDTREEIKSMMQPINDLREVIDGYEIGKGLRPEGAFMTTQEIR